jgi:hypothetical protein
MMITSKSLHHSNIVFVFDKNRFYMPENHLLASFHRGEIAAGSRFADDAIRQAKVLDLPKLRMQFTIEPGRLRIDDYSQEEPGKSSLIKEALSFYESFFAQDGLIGFGYNFDIYYQTDRVIRTQDLFAGFVGGVIPAKSEVLDLGVQFTLDKPNEKRRETYFIKITAPLEIAVHVNFHFPIIQHSAGSGLPALSDIDESFADCYVQADSLIRELKF